MMTTVIYPINSDFLVRHNNTCDSHYWANWDLASMTSILAIGVLCDDQSKFDEALAYFVSGIGEGAIDNAVHYIHPDGLGQWQESGRDQGHNTLGMALMGPFCEIAWNQGVDLYGYEQNKFLSSCEYVAKYNLGNDVPYVTYINCESVIQTNISSASRGIIRSGWDLLYNHYVNRMGVAAPYTAQYAEMVRPEGGGGNYGSTSGGYDSLGFTTLTHTLDPIADGAVPGELRPIVEGNQITLSWQGSAYTGGYTVKRSQQLRRPLYPHRHNRQQRPLLCRQRPRSRRNILLCGCGHFSRRRRPEQYGGSCSNRRSFVWYTDRNLRIMEQRRRHRRNPLRRLAEKLF